MARLEEACLLLGVDTSWKSNAVAAAGFCPRKAGDRPSAPRPAISRAQLCELTTSRCLQGDLALIALIGWPFLLRIPSECLPCCRQQAGETSTQKPTWLAELLSGPKEPDCWSNEADEDTWPPDHA